MDLDVLRHHGQVLGPDASAQTLCRGRDELPPAALGRIEKARAKVRRHIWFQLAAGRRMPASRVADTDLRDVIVLDVDATSVTAHSEKESTATFKGGFGYHPLAVWCDNICEMLGAAPRVTPVRTRPPTTSSW